MECCMMWNVCGLDGLQRKVVKNGVVKSVWCEIAMWCGMSWSDFKCFVAGMDIQGYV